MRSRSLLLPAALLISLLTGIACGGQRGVLVLKGGRVVTVTQGVFDPGTVVVEGGKITAVGPAAQVAVPAGAQVRDTTGMVVIPGLVDTHCHLGVASLPSVRANSDTNEMTGPVEGAVRAIDSINPQDPGFRIARAGGITTVNVLPGSGNVIGGQCAYLKCRGKTVEEMLIDLHGGPSGLKMANGENPKRSYGGRGQKPTTRMGVAELQRAAFLKAREYEEKWRAYDNKVAKGDKNAERPARDLDLAPLVEVLERKRTVHFHCHRADDILSAIRLSKEFGFELVLHHVTEAYKVVDEIAKAKVPVTLILLDSPGGKPETEDLRLDNAAICAKAGILVALHSDDPVIDSRFLLREGGLAIRGGMTHDGALEALTINGARILHLQNRVGSLEKGKDGDVVLLSGDPFDVSTRVLATYIEGELVFDRSRPEDLRYATGGYRVASRLPATDFPAEAPAPPAARPRGAHGDPAARKLAILAGRVHTCAGPPIENGTVLIADGRIQAVGPRADVAIPDGYSVVCAAEVTPGLIDAHSSVGLSGSLNIDADEDEDTAPNQAGLRVLDGFNPHEALLNHLLRHGVTLIQCMPGPKEPIAGQAGIFRTYGETADSMVVKFPSAMLFNLGETPKAVFGGRGRKPGTRMGTAAVIRRALVDAQNPRKKKDDEGPDLNRIALEQVVQGKIPAIFSAHREDDVATALRLMREFHLKGAVSQATEGYLAAGALAAAKTPVLCPPTMERMSSLERVNACLENPAFLAEAGVPIAITSGFEGYVPKTRVVLYEAAVAAANGLGRERALAAITIGAAKILGIADRFGSLEPGKVADVVCYDGDPFSYESHVQMVYVGGTLAYRR